MTKQKIRKFITIFMFFIFPAIYYYYSPYLIIDAAIKGIINGSFIIFIILTCSGLVFGRAYCGWICPIAGMQESCEQISKKRAKNGIFNLIKWIIWTLWLIPIIVFIFKNYNNLSIEFFYQTKDSLYLSMSRPADVIIYLLILAVIFIMFLLFGKRAFCHYLCWMAPFMIIGDKIGRILRFPSLQLKADKSKCINCKKCNQTCQMSLNVEKMVTEDKMHNYECVLCGECIEVCPKKVIKFNKNLR